MGDVTHRAQTFPEKQEVPRRESTRKGILRPQEVKTADVGETPECVLLLLVKRCMNFLETPDRFTGRVYDRKYNVCLLV